MTKDKVYHFFACFVLTLFIGIVCTWIGLEDDRAIAIGGVGAFAIAIGKELYDKFVKKTYISIYDLIADLIGIACATFAMMF